MSSAPSNDPSRWKQKYAEVLQTLEEQRGESERAQRLLCRIIIRLTLATSGLDSRLDPHLLHIRDLLRKGVIDDRLGAELDSWSEALLRESKGAHASGGLERLAEPLFRFLKDIVVDGDERSALVMVETRVARGEIADAGALFAVLRDILRPVRGVTRTAEGAKSRLLGRWFGQGSAAGIEGELVRERLLQMLTIIEVPPRFHEAVATIKTRLQGGVAAGDMPEVITGAIDILTEVRTHIQNEQREIDGFLELLTGNLSELEHQAAGMDASAQAVVEAHQAEDSVLGDQFRVMEDCLDTVPEGVRQYLTDMDTRYRSSRARELGRLRDTQSQLGKLASRLRDLEMETTDLRTKLRLAHDMALRDPLTGVPNRKAYDERIAHEIARWNRFQHPFTLLVWDIDHFKSINDRFGHAAGDKVLIGVARELMDSTRESDMVARYGGEEFVTILCGAGGEAALRVADNLRSKIAAYGFNSQGKPVLVTISCGLSEYRYGDTVHSLFERADRALYEAKQTGRDRCILI